MEHLIAEQNIKIATFMNYPTPLLKGRITNSLAEKLYNDWNSLMSVIEEIEKITFPHKYGDYSITVKISTNYTEIQAGRCRKNSGFKDGVFDTYGLAIEFGKPKEERTRKAIITFLDTYKTFEPK